MTCRPVSAEQKRYALMLSVSVQLPFPRQMTAQCHSRLGHRHANQLRGYFSLLLVSEDGLHPSLQGFRQRSASFGIVEIPNIPKVPKVKWNIVLALRD